MSRPSRAEASCSVLEADSLAPHTPRALLAPLRGPGCQEPPARGRLASDKRRGTSGGQAWAYCPWPLWAWSHSRQPQRASWPRREDGSREAKAPQPSLLGPFFHQPPITFLHHPTWESGEKAAPILCPWEGALGGVGGSSPQTPRLTTRKNVVKR